MQHPSPNPHLERRSGEEGSAYIITLMVMFTLTVIGLLVSASFYPLYRLIGWTAMVIDWMLLWVLTGWLNRWLRDNHEPLSRAVIRGVAAAIFSGLAFYAVSDIWTTAHEGGFLWNFACWLLAFFPGLFAMLHPWPKR